MLDVEEMHSSILMSSQVNVNVINWQSFNKPRNKLFNVKYEEGVYSNDYFMKDCYQFNTKFDQPIKVEVNPVG